MPSMGDIVNGLAGNGDNGAKVPLSRLALTANGEQFAEMIQNALLTRTNMFEKLLDPRRDINKECGYPETDGIELVMYKQLFDRECIANRVVSILPEECWQTSPRIFEDDDPNKSTKFETAWDELGANLRGPSWFAKEKGSPIWTYLKRLDILSGIGHFGILILGVNDGKPLSEELEGVEAPLVKMMGKRVVNAEKKNRRLVYVQPVSEDLIEIAQYEMDRNHPRYGHPVLYSVTMSDLRESAQGNAPPGGTVKIHWTRVIHVADSPGVSDLFAPPRMRPVYNRLLDLRKLYSGSAEMYWQGAFPGISVETHPQLGSDVNVDAAATKAAVKNYIHGLQRMLLTKGMTIRSLSPQVVDPSAQIDAQINAICIKLGIPKRIFEGSERGELASGQDDSTWKGRLKERRMNFIVPSIIIPFVDRLILCGVLPEPKEFFVDWEEERGLQPAERVTIATQKTDAIAKYIGGGVDAMIDPLDYLTKFLEMDEDEAKQVLDAAVKQPTPPELQQPEGEEGEPGKKPPFPPKKGSPVPPKGKEKPEEKEEESKGKKKPTNAEDVSNAGGNCGIGPGGFQPGNTCAKGGGGGGGAGGGGSSSGKFDADEWEKLSVPDRIAKWEGMSVRERDAMANAGKSVPKRMQEHMKGLPKHPNTGNLDEDVLTRVEHYSGRVAQESASMISKTSKEYVSTLRAAGVSEADARELSMMAVDALATQEMEACTRQLGDHGIHHIEGNIKVAKQIMDSMPQDMTAQDHLVMQTAMIFHDAGYMAPPSQHFLDEGHPRWSQNHFDENVRPTIERALGKETAAEIAHVVRTHDSSDLDWDNDPVASASRVADNVALFRKEKLPPVFRHVPENVDVLKKLGNNEIDVDTAHKTMRKNVDDADLPDHVKKLMHRAVDEVTPMTHKFTIGMLGGHVEKVGWEQDHLHIGLKRDPEMTELHKLGDFGQKQFGKFAKSYGMDPERFKTDLAFEVIDNAGRRLMRVTANRRGTYVEFDVNAKRMSDADVENHLQGKHDQSAHGKGRGKIPGGGDVQPGSKAYKKLSGKMKETVLNKILDGVDAIGPMYRSVKTKGYNRLSKAKREANQSIGRLEGMSRAYRDRAFSETGKDRRVLLHMAIAASKEAYRLKTTVMDKR